MKTPSSKMIIISIENTGQRIDNFLYSYLKGIPKSMIYRILRTGQVRVNKKRVKPKYKLEIDDVIRIPPLQTTKCEALDISPHLRKISVLSDIILYEDKQILVLNKPTGFAVHGGSKLNFGMIEGLRVLRPKSRFLQLVHRLDRDTSGVLLVAKKRSALLSLHKQLREKIIQKNYLALVHGHWKSCIKVIQAPLLKINIPGGERVVQINLKGKPSETHFNVEEYYNLTTLLRCQPITGRMHQIRKHTQYVGHPIVFDNLYGDKEFDKNLLTTGLSRLFLHAVSLKFIHPHTGVFMEIKAPLDKELKQCLKILRNQIM